jgi:hypothetical protein
MPTPRSSQSYVTALSILTLLFFLRVLGQILVATETVDFLPPMEEWSSGLIPYPILLPIQMVMIGVMAKIVRDFAKGEGSFAIPRRREGIFLKWFSYLYFLSMVVRYLATMWLHPELRWFSGTIPIWFHMILAAFLYTLSHYYRQAERSDACLEEKQNKENGDCNI